MGEKASEEVLHARLTISFAQSNVIYYFGKTLEKLNLVTEEEYYLGLDRVWVVP